MIDENDRHPDDSVSRRDFMKSSAAATVGTLTAAQLAVATRAYAGGTDTLRLGLIGCGGRGTGAAHNAMEASPQVRLVAMADVFRDRLEDSRQRLSSFGDRVAVPDSRRYVGFDAYAQLLASDVDVVVLATPPHFRPLQFRMAIDAGKHVFMEKPVAVDPKGIKTILAASDMADRKGLCVVAGTQRRHEASYRAAMKQVQDGAIGSVVAARCYWNMGGLWMKEPRAEWTDMEWQLRNWLYFTWLSGDHIVEQHVHNLDVVNWAMGTHPVRAQGMGGRQVRTDPNYGQIFDHFAIEYEYPDDVFLMSMCRQIDGTWSQVAEAIHGTDGTCMTRPGFAVIQGRSPWRFEAENPNPYVQEHRDLVAAITAGPRVNEARNVAESTLTAIMGRMAAYTGKEITWEQALNSSLDLAPPAYEFGPMGVAPVPMPGKTPLV